VTQQAWTLLFTKAAHYQQAMGGLGWERKKRKRNVVKNTKKRKENAVLSVQRHNYG
jgi:hypothetical protein